ncbi:MAG TPA: glycosyltransferase [Chitinophagaceae bacterium]|nr:glycosyltransferase [Chitinophagaceae bacterium]
MNSFPPVSLVIPVFNESKTMEALIQTILAQSLPPNEIILVDGGSEDNTVKLTRELTAGDNRFQIIESKRAMPGEGRNLGMGKVKNDWVAFTDAGISLDPHWLEKLVNKAKEDPGISIVYGNYAPQIRSFFEKCALIAYVPPQRPGQIRNKTIVSCLLKKEIWEKTGGFPDWRATEDLVFMEKAEQLGYKFGFAPGAIAHWQLRPGLRSTFEKFDLYSKYNVWAGRQAYWHYGIARQYILMLVFIGLGIYQHWLWFLVLPLWMIARVVKRIYMHRSEFGIAHLFNPAFVVMVMLITLTIDMATFSGWIKAIFRKNPVRSSRNSIAL